MLANIPFSTTPYKDVRGLHRGLQVLKAMNRMPGGIATTTEIATMCDIHRTTSKRLLETLRVDGFVRPGDRDGQYCLTFEVRRLSEGFKDEAWVEEVAKPLMQSSVSELLWPCDLATVDAGFMVVRESTHRWSNLSQHRAMIGERMPIFVTALGRAYLSACSGEELGAVTELLGQRSDWIGEAARDKPAVRSIIRQTQKRGYAINEGEWIRDPHFSAVAVPVRSGARLLGAINLIFPKAAVDLKHLKTRYVPRLKALAEAIGKNSKAWLE